jgi:hypothetical protein
MGSQGPVPNHYEEACTPFFSENSLLKSPDLVVDDNIPFFKNIIFIYIKKGEN